MLISRVRLLSDYAQRYQENASRLFKEPNIWSSVLNLFRDKKQKTRICGYEGIAKTEEELAQDGLVPFCEIDRRRIYFSKVRNEIIVAIRTRDEIWDLKEWGRDSEFVVRFIAECYFMVTRDDFKIDNEEKAVLQALIGYIEPAYDDLVAARNIVYWSLVENVIEDDEVTDEESEIMMRIRAALRIDEKEVFQIHRKALIEKYAELKAETHDAEELDLVRFEKLKRMAERLGVSSDIFA